MFRALSSGREIAGDFFLGEGKCLACVGLDLIVRDNQSSAVPLGDEDQRGVKLTHLERIGTTEIRRRIG